MRSITRVLLCGVILFGTMPLRAQDEPRKDAEGCQDSPLVTRFAGSEKKEHEQADYPLSDNRVKHVEGEFHSWDIGTREGTSEIQAFRSFEAAFKTAGLTIDYFLSPSQIT